jgi:lipid II:glycine glycyltransferase (peptidoglycan interpeptide bridge formation enzyme)
LTFITNLENAFLCGIKKAGRIEAVSLFAYTPYCGEFLFNVSVPEGRHHSFPLLWYSMKYLKSLSIPLLNLGGGIEENDGVAQFKKRFGGTEFVFHSLKQIYDPGIYNSLCKKRNVNPEDMTGYFPAYRK